MLSTFEKIMLQVYTNTTYTILFYVGILLIMILILTVVFSIFEEGFSWEIFGRSLSLSFIIFLAGITIGYTFTSYSNSPIPNDFYVKHFDNLENIEEYNLIGYMNDDMFLKETDKEFKIQYNDNEKIVEKSFEKYKEISSDTKINKDTLFDILKYNKNFSIIKDGKNKIVKKKVITDIDNFEKNYIKDDSWNKYIYEIHI